METETLIILAVAGLGFLLIVAVLNHAWRRSKQARGDRSRGEGSAEGSNGGFFGFPWMPMGSGSGRDEVSQSDGAVQQHETGQGHSQADSREAGSDAGGWFDGGSDGGSDGGGGGD